MSHHFRPIRCVDGISQDKKCQESLVWHDLLLAIREGADVKGSVKKIILPVTAFHSPVFSRYFNAISPGLKLEIRIHDFDGWPNVKEIYWIVVVQKICGYMLLLRFMGMDEDDEYDFWINFGSKELRNLGYSQANKCQLSPPNLVRKRHKDIRAYLIEHLGEDLTLCETFAEVQQKILCSGRYECGQRVELLDSFHSYRLRPGRIAERLGRRVLINISFEDMPSGYTIEEEDLQAQRGVWLEENSCLIFPVGWAKYNGYGLLASDAYDAHCDAIAKALEAKETPPYHDIDVKYEIFKEWLINENTAKDTFNHWEVGLKFECLDPLNMNQLELRAATCTKLLKDGFLEVGFDDPESLDEESLPLHHRSPLLFPVGYGKMYDITVRGPAPKRRRKNREFSWFQHLRDCKGKMAPEVLFDAVPTADELSEFKIGGKLEASDICETNLICPATLISIHGRLLRIHFDGFTRQMDQLVDYRSHDIFPVGWCEMYNYPLQIPPNMKKKYASNLEEEEATDTPSTSEKARSE